MKTRPDAGQQRRPYSPPVVKRQSNLKLITLFTQMSPDPKRTVASSR
ncbi:MAG TPA: hypothetical protein VKA63_04825 [Candidatus Krumholzibacteria bacterium]|nr:hypothetical protein [Candidatus Krumholzibacteria bacterium]